MDVNRYGARWHVFSCRAAVVRQLADFAAIRRASSLVSSLAADRRPGSSLKLIGSACG